ncbi:hypothetical protein HPB51_003108 [Rhipicephalus microplus]|uniref:Store-operated calcium entry-associated regulatory factor n=1 Tax=Rhipicephalus microplus TaxID=6941 RepID=A0A9J6EL28_RHIMP|nr:hypothetical protein HPB51_003108 [Rhipicephalus microplus]
MSARTFSSRTSLALSLAVILLLIDPAHPWGGKKVKLKDVEVLTLRQGQYTTGRRSSPVPQLTCLGGSAGCQNAPAVVQCYNRGSDGYSTQWECKADMSKSQKFGTVEVTCEGYDYADDDYILAGSCGLSVHLWFQIWFNLSNNPLPCCGRVRHLRNIPDLPRSWQMDDAPPAYDDGPPPDYPGPPRGGGFFGSGFFGGGGRGGGVPPPPGFRPAYQTDASCGSARAHGAGGVGGGGFWTGAAAGGLLGYLLGNSKMKVPNCAMCGTTLIRRTVYRRQIDACRTCGPLTLRCPLWSSPATPEDEGSQWNTDASISDSDRTVSNEQDSSTDLSDNDQDLFSDSEEYTTDSSNLIHLQVGVGNMSDLEDLGDSDSSSVQVLSEAEQLDVSSVVEVWTDRGDEPPDENEDDQSVSSEVRSEPDNPDTEVEEND